jgi:hypothetical protein
LIRNHQIDCSLHSCDRFIAAHSARVTSAERVP